MNIQDSPLKSRNNSTLSACRCCHGFGGQPILCLVRPKTNTFFLNRFDPICDSLEPYFTLAEQLDNQALAFFAQLTVFELVVFVKYLGILLEVLKDKRQMMCMNQPCH